MIVYKHLLQDKLFWIQEC